MAWHSVARHFLSMTIYHKKYNVPNFETLDFFCIRIEYES